MRAYAGIVLVLGLHSCMTLGKKKICPLQGQQWLAPNHLATEDFFQNATRSLENILNANLTVLPYNESTFSIGMFSTTDEGLLWEYHHADRSVADRPKGTRAVDANSIYRIASMTKILTLYMWLIEDGDGHFNTPITDFLPQLAQYQVDQDDYAAPLWDEITVNDLAMYLAGVARDYGLNDVAIQDYVTSQLPPMTTKALPDNPANGIDVPATDDPVCGYFTANLNYDSCSRETYLHQVANLASSFVPGYTPLYSNVNFAIIALALAEMLGLPETQIFERSIVQPLGLTGSTFRNPEHVGNRAVIPGEDETATGWNDRLGPVNGAAGGFSTTNDLAKIGRSILNSTLLPQATTRRWFSTTTFVDTIDQAVGRGWEIFRRRIDGQSVDFYTKSGSWGIYASVLFLIPDYNFGFSILTASINASGQIADSLPNNIVELILPALETIARQQARDNLAGHFASATANTSITLATDERPALRVTHYVANDVDLLHGVFSLFEDHVDFRLVPNKLYRGERIGFTGVYQPPTSPLPDREFYWPCQSWLDVDDFTYASVPLGNMVFQVNGSGRAVSVRLNALRETLLRRDE